MIMTLNYDEGILYGFQFGFSTKRTWVLWYRKDEGKLEFTKGIMNTENCVRTHADIISHFKNSDDKTLCLFARELLLNKQTEEFWKSLMHVEREELEAFFNEGMIEALKECASRYKCPENVFVKYVGGNTDTLVKNFFYLVVSKGEAFTKISNGTKESIVPNNYLEFV